MMIFSGVVFEFFIVDEVFEVNGQYVFVFGFVFDFFYGGLLMMQVIDYFVDVFIGDFGGQFFNGDFVQVIQFDFWQYFEDGNEFEIFVFFYGFWFKFWLVCRVDVLFLQCFDVLVVYDFVNYFLVDVVIEMMFNYFEGYFVWVEIIQVYGVCCFLQVFLDCLVNFLGGYINCYVMFDVGGCFNRYLYGRFLNYRFSM